MKYEIKGNLFDKFSCIASDCSITCCQEWKIEVDASTYQKWDSIRVPKENLNILTTYTRQKGKRHIIKLNRDKKCPFLNEKKLCKLVTALGDTVLSHTCATFPRQVQEFLNHKEYSLVTCCPEVVDLLWKEEKIQFPMGELKEDQDLVFEVRSLLIEIMENSDYTVQKALLMSFYILQEIEKKQLVSKEELKEYKKETLLQELSKAIDQMEFSLLDTFDEANELLLDLSVNYRKEGLYSEYLEGVATLAESFCEEYEGENLEKSLLEFEKEMKPYQELFRNYLVLEFFNNLLSPNGDLESMVVKLQWIALEYVVIRQGILLQWLITDQQRLTYEIVRDYIVIISRMTGYEEEDIVEYLEDSFQKLIWEWGYFALIVGN